MSIAIDGFSSALESGIGARIAQVRAGKKLSQRVFAERLGISAGYLSEVETGKKVPGGEVLLALKRAFDVDLNWLVSNATQSDFRLKMERLAPRQGFRGNRGNRPHDLAKAAARRRTAARSELRIAFSEFETHQLEMRDPVDQPNYVQDDDVPTREALLEQFCALYIMNGPKSLGLPEWMMTVYPSLTPDDVIAALQPEEAESEQTWVQIPAVDGSAWLAVVAELVANGVTPQQVLAKFRPNKVDDEPPEITHLMF